MRSFVDWEVLADTETRDRYVAGEPCSASLASFPSACPASRPGASQPSHPDLIMAHRGLDMEVVMLRASP